MGRSKPENRGDIVSCPHCEVRLIDKNLPDHLSRCPENPNRGIAAIAKPTVALPTLPVPEIAPVKGAHPKTYIWDKMPSWVTDEQKVVLKQRLEAEKTCVTCGRATTAVSTSGSDPPGTGVVLGNGRPVVVCSEKCYHQLQGVMKAVAKPLPQEQVEV